MSDLFYQLLAQAETVTGESISDNSRKTYNSGISVYETIMNSFIHVDPFPITENKIKAFLMFQKEKNVTLSTLLSYLTSFTLYFKENDLDVLTQTISFKLFKS